MVAHLHGRHLRCGLSAVSWIEADQSRLGDVRRSKLRSLSRMTPFPAAASSTNWSRGDFWPARHSGRCKRARRGQSMMWSRGGEVRHAWEVRLRLSARCPQQRRTRFWSSKMSHALLLRLFLSPSFFSVHVALQYLMQYADNVGITYYLTRRLRELDTQELRDVWGFIW